MKRYAIVRVDEGCPLSGINIRNINACKISKSCQNCLFGDTKEQLIRKVAQALKINTEKYYGEKELDYELLAEEIVEFLGVEE